jgi:hypothetical protein
MSLDEIFKQMDRWGKFVSVLTAVGGLFVMLSGNRILAYFLIFVTLLLIELWLTGILRQPENSEEQKAAAKLGFRAIVILAIGGMVWWLVTITSSLPVQVFSAVYLFVKSGINVNAGDQLIIKVPDPKALWDCGRGKTATPEGYRGERYSDLVYLQADACSLIGSVSPKEPEIYFAIGYYTSFVVKASGDLYLGCNDSKGRFGDNPTDSHLNVSVRVIRWTNLIPTVLALLILIFGIVALRRKQQ